MYRNGKHCIRVAQCYFVIWADPHMQHMQQILYSFSFRSVHRKPPYSTDHQNVFIKKTTKIYPKSSQWERRKIQTAWLTKQWREEKKTNYTHIKLLVTNIHKNNMWYGFDFNQKKWERDFKREPIMKVIDQRMFFFFLRNDCFKQSNKQMKWNENRLIRGLLPLHQTEKQNELG